MRAALDWSYRLLSAGAEGIVPVAQRLPPQATAEASSKVATRSGIVESAVLRAAHRSPEHR